MRKNILCGSIAALVALGPVAANADGLPGMRGHDHTGITVPDMSEALTFFVDVLGCKKAMSFGPIADPEPNGTFMKDALGVDPKTVIKQITLVRCGMGSNIELFSYQSPDQKVVQPKNSDIGGYHIAFYVDDIKAAADYLRAKNVKTMMEPFRSPRVQPRGSRLSISTRPGGSSWRRFPIRRAWPTRKMRQRSCGLRRTRPNRALARPRTTRAANRSEIELMVAWDRVGHEHVLRAIKEYDRLGPERFFWNMASLPQRPMSSPRKTAATRPRRSWA